MFYQTNLVGCYPFAKNNCKVELFAPLVICFKMLTLAIFISPFVRKVNHFKLRSVSN